MDPIVVLAHVDDGRTSVDQGDGLDRLPAELWSHILCSERIGVPPKERFLVRRVCTTWRDLLDGAAACDVGVPQRLVPDPSDLFVWSHYKQARLQKAWPQTLKRWASGRLVSARAVSAWLGSRRVKHHTNPSDVVEWLYGLGGIGPLYVAAILVASGDPALQAHAVETLLPTMVAKNQVWSAEEHPGARLLAASVYAPDHAPFDMLARLDPTLAHAYVVLDAVIAQDDAVLFERVLRSHMEQGWSRADHVNRMCRCAGTKRIVRYCVETACSARRRPHDLDKPRRESMESIRDLDVLLARWFYGSSSYAHFVDALIKHGNLNGLRIVRDHSSMVRFDWVVPDICGAQSVAGAQWMLETFDPLSHNQRKEYAGLLSMLACGACRSGGSNDDELYADHGDRLLAWLCRGPHRLDPMSPPTSDSDLTMLFDIATLEHHGNAAAAVWLCENWMPQIVDARSPDHLVRVVGRIVGLCAANMTCDYRKALLARLVAWLDRAHQYLRTQDREDAANAMVRETNLWSIAFDRLARAKYIEASTWSTVLVLYEGAHGHLLFPPCRPRQYAAEGVGKRFGASRRGRRNPAHLQQTSSTSSSPQDTASDAFTDTPHGDGDQGGDDAIAKAHIYTLCEYDPTRVEGPSREIVQEQTDSADTASDEVAATSWTRWCRITPVKFQTLANVSVDLAAACEPPLWWLARRRLLRAGPGDLSTTTNIPYPLVVD